MCAKISCTEPCAPLTKAKMLRTDLIFMWSPYFPKLRPTLPSHLTMPMTILLAVLWSAVRSARAHHRDSS